MHSQTDRDKAMKRYLLGEGNSEPVYDKPAVRKNSVRDRDI